MAKEYKKKYVKEISELINGKNIIFIDYKGITVAQITELRDKLREKESSLKVIKNRLFKIAADSIEYPYDPEIVKGTTGLVTANGDFAATAKIINDSEKAELLTIKGGSFNNKPVTAEDVKKISQIPSREVLLSQLVTAMHSPISGFVHSLSSITGNFVGVLQSIEEEKKKNNKGE